MELHRGKSLYMLHFGRWGQIARGGIFCWGRATDFSWVVYPLRMPRKLSLLSPGKGTCPVSQQQWHGVPRPREAHQAYIPCNNRGDPVKDHCTRPSPSTEPRIQEEQAWSGVWERSSGLGERAVQGRRPTGEKACGDGTYWLGIQHWYSWK